MTADKAPRNCNHSWHHAWHNEDCTYEPDPCNCGFDKRIAELEALDKESEGAG